MPIALPCPGAGAARLARILLQQFDELVRMPHGQRTQHDRVHNGENGRVSADAKRERCDCYGGEPRTAPHTAQGITRILPQPIRHPSTPNMARGFLDERPIAEFPAHSKLGRLRLFASIHPVADCHRQVSLDFFIEFPVATPAAEAPLDVHAFPSLSPGLMRVVIAVLN